MSWDAYIAELNAIKRTYSKFIRDINREYQDKESELGKRYRTELSVINSEWDARVRDYRAARDKAITELQEKYTITDGKESNGETQS